MNAVKRLLILWFGVTCALTLFAGGGKSLILVSPGAGVNLNEGQSFFIHWTYTGYEKNTLVRIALWQNGNKLGEVTSPLFIQNPRQANGNGGYFWTVGKVANKRATPGCGYKISVRVSDPIAVIEVSSGAFCIAGKGQEAGIKVSAPNGGESWLLDGSQEIRWTSSGLNGNVKIRLRKPGWPADKAIADNVPLANGKYVWKVGDCLAPHPDVTEGGSDFKVVVQTQAGDYSGVSDKAFTIVKPSFMLIPGQSDESKWLIISAPKAGESFVRTASVCEIKWTCSESLKGKKTKIQLIKPDGSQQMVIETKCPLSSGIYKWNVPGAAILPVGDYKIRLQAVDFPDIKVVSGVFHVTALTEKRVVKYSFTPVISNKGSMTFKQMGDWTGKAFMPNPNVESVKDPGPDCCRIGWTNDCSTDGYEIHWVYRSHLELKLNKIPKTAKILSARLTWTEQNAPPNPVNLFKLTESWDHVFPEKLFSVSCVPISPNDPNQLRDAVQEWVKVKQHDWGLLFAGSDESRSCGYPRTSVHVLCNVRLEVEAEVLAEQD